MKANYQLLIISCQSPDGTEYHKSFEGLKKNSQNSQTAWSVCWPNSFFIFQIIFLAIVVRLLILPRYLSNKSQERLSVSWELEEGPDVHISASLSVSFLPLTAFLCPLLEPLNSSLIGGKKRDKGVSQSKIHRLTGAIPWERHGCIIVKNRMFEENLLACISPKNKLEILCGKLSQTNMRTLGKGFQTSG